MDKLNGAGGSRNSGLVAAIARSCYGAEEAGAQTLTAGENGVIERLR